MDPSGRLLCQGYPHHTDLVRSWRGRIRPILERAAPDRPARAVVSPPAGARRSGAVALLVLLARPAPARVVAPDLLGLLDAALLHGRGRLHRALGDLLGRADVGGGRRGDRARADRGAGRVGDAAGLLAGGRARG